MFDRESIEIGQAVDARKEKIEGDDAWKLLSASEEIVVGKGKKSIVFTPADDNREEILKVSLGRTGNLRAPTLKIGKRMLVGYNDDMYNSYLK